MPRRKTRIDVIWIAIALVVGASGLALATAAPSAGGGMPAGTLQLAAAADPALTSGDPADDAAAARLADATGVPASDAAPPQTWAVGARSVLGYSASGGRFCFEFRALGGGCLAPGALSGDQPLDVTTDYGPETFHVYGLALDGVTGVSVEVGGRSQPAAFGHNAFYFSDDELGGTYGVTGDVVATMDDGSTRELPFRVDSLESSHASP